MRWIGDAARGDWIGPRLSGWGRVGGIAPRGFDAYARVFHPVVLDRVLEVEPRIKVEERDATWREITERFGTIWHPRMQWGAIALRRDEQFDIGDGWRLNEPAVGRLGLRQLAAIARLADGPVTAAVWYGYGDFRRGSGLFFAATSDTSPGDAAAERARLVAEMAATVSDEVAHASEYGPRLELPAREYVLFEADAAEFTDPAWVSTAGIGWWSNHGPTPNLLWPDDRSWFLATEIDFDSTIVAGDRAFIDGVLADPDLESAEVDPDDSLQWDADTINPPYER